MFSENDKISKRQLQRLLTLELFGMTTLLLPGLLCHRAGRDGLAALVVGMFFVVIFAMLMCGLIKKADGDIFGYMKKCLGKTGSDFVTFWFLIQTVILGSFVLCLCGELIRSVLLPNMDTAWIIISFWLICMYGASKGIECRGRMSEVVFWPFMIPFIIVLIVAARGIHVEYMSAVLAENEIDVFWGGYEVLVIFQGLLLNLFTLPYLEKKRSAPSCIRHSILWNGFFCACLFLIVIGVFGANTAAAQKWPVIILMTTTGVLGGFIKRLDIFMIAIWIAALFFLLSGSIFYGQKLTEKLFEIKQSIKTDLIIAVLILFGALAVGSRSMAYYIYKNYMFYIGIPVVVLIFILLIIIGSIIERRKN